MSDLLERLRSYISMQQPHQSRRMGGKLLIEAAEEIARLQAELERCQVDRIGLEEFVRNAICDCHDEYGNRKPAMCDRCRLLATAAR